MPESIDRAFCIYFKLPVKVVMPLCQLCTAIDFTAPLSPENKLIFGWSEGHPLNHDIFYYHLAKDRKLERSNIKFLYHHNSMEALEASAVLCSLCGLIKNCVDSTLANLRKAREMDFEQYKWYKMTGYQFMLWQEETIEGFQVLGSLTEKSDRYLVMGGIRIHVDDGKPGPIFSIGR